MKRTIFVCLMGVALCRAQAPNTYTITTVAGEGDSGFTGDGGPATGAELNFPVSVAVDSSGNLYIADQLNNRIRKVISTGTISTIVGDGTPSYFGDGKAATSAELYGPSGVAVDNAGNLYIADTNNNVIRKVVSNGTISTIVGDNTAGYGADGGPATVAQINHPSAVALDSAGNLYIADTSNNVIRKVATNGTISTVAGSSTPGYAGDGKQATQADLWNPVSVVVDAAGNLYIGDTNNHRVRKVTTGGIISTVAGTGTAGYSGDGGPATRAQLNSPKGVAVDSAGNLYIADSINSRIRRVTPDGTITTVAGTGTAGYSGDGGPATSARLRFPSGVTADSSGNVYVTDNQNNRIRILAPVKSGPPIIGANGVISAGAFGGFASVAPGSWIEIYGSNLAVNTRGWTTADFKGINAPTSLDGTSVSVGGLDAFVDYISPTQVNAQVPSGVGTGPQQITVTTAAGTSPPYTITVNPTQPGILAPSTFNAGGKQYVVALFGDGVTYVLPPGAIPGIVSRQAHPGETITMYGVGFGPVTPDFPAGQIVRDFNQLVSPVQIFFGQAEATLSYSGLAPGYIGLYQFNVVVPNVAASDAVPLAVFLGGVRGPQTMYTAVQ